MSRDGVPDATTLLGFRHLLEAHDLTATILETINAQLRRRGLLLASQGYVGGCDHHRRAVVDEEPGEGA